MFQSIGQNNTFEVSNDSNFRFINISKHNQSINDTKILASKKSSLQNENPVLDSQVKIIKTNSWDMQSVNDFYFSNENNQLILPDDFYVTNENTTVA